MFVFTISEGGMLGGMWFYMSSVFLSSRFMIFGQNTLWVGWIMDRLQFTILNSDIIGHVSGLDCGVPPPQLITSNSDMLRLTVLVDMGRT